ncbi:MAG: serine/threonine protein phosphatase, partial [Rikenellaceae bacterium]|nr:serine/threonine protein phosphatase [Rikenellaceae bacterium]
MKHKIILLFLAAGLGFQPLSAQQKAEQMRRTDPEAFSMILLPDPQNYVKYDYNQP